MPSHTCIRRDSHFCEARLQIVDGVYLLIGNHSHVNDSVLVRELRISRIPPINLQFQIIEQSVAGHEDNAFNLDFMQAVVQTDINPCVICMINACNTALDGCDHVFCCNCIRDFLNSFFPMRCPLCRALCVVIRRMPTSIPQLSLVSGLDVANMDFMQDVIQTDHDPCIICMVNACNTALDCCNHVYCCNCMATYCNIIFPMPCPQCRALCVVFRRM